MFPGLMLSLAILALNMIGDYITKTLTKHIDGEKILLYN